MAIQTVNLTVPGGDTPRSANTKINANFSNTTHAASKLVGTAAGNVMEVGAFGLGSETTTRIGVPLLTEDQMTSSLNPPKSGFYRVNDVTSDNRIGYTSVLQMGYRDGYFSQIAVQQGLGNKVLAYVRSTDSSTPKKIITAVLYNDKNPIVYNTTTANGANVVVSETGELQRSTSSERYKDILAPLELDDARYADAMALKPIVYRSTAGADNPSYHYYSFSAEELGTYDPAFTLWRETETVTDKDGNVIEQPLAERQAEGININALLAMSHAIAIKQDKIIKSLEARIDVLEAK